jgi:protein phosphatase
LLRPKEWSASVDG